MTPFVKANDLVSRSIGGETIIVPITNGVGDLSAIYTLNEVAARIWDLIDGNNGVKEIVETIAKEYEVTGEEAEKDVVDYLRSLEQARLVKGFNTQQ